MQESISGAASSGPLAGVAPQMVDSQSAIAGSRIAPMTDRAIAAFIDMIVMCAAFPVAGMWAAAQWGGATSSGFELNGLPALFVITVVGVAGFLYLWVGEGVFGATLGKAAMSLRVRSAAGGKPGLQKSLLRNVLRIVDGIGVYVVGLVFALTSPTRQRLGDRVAGTLVVRVDSPGKTRPAAAIACVAILIASFQIIGAATTFPSSQPNVVCVFQIQGVAAGTPIRAVWMVDDVGSAAPANSKLIEKTVTAPDGGTVPGNFVLTAPAGGLPAGKYHLDIYIGDALAKTLPFTITQSS